MAYDAFLKLAGVTGESQKALHAGEIDLLSFSWGASNSSSVDTGTGASVGKVAVGDFSIIKATDKSSPTIFNRCCDGSVIAQAVVTLQKSAGAAGPLAYLVYTFTNVYITSVQWSGNGSLGDTPTESVTFCSEVATIDYTPQKNDGSAGEAIHGGWDVGQNIKA
jgi:type VI secretion system secreted protein Hcp